ncbi:hypothetical protein ACFSHQ_13575 [Gemmobacter lanyuensis]
MLSKTYHLKFPSLDAAQIAAPFVVEALGNAIPACNLNGLNVLISKEGDVSINVFFPGISDLKTFEKNRRFPRDHEKDLPVQIHRLRRCLHLQLRPQRRRSSVTAGQDEGQGCAMAQDGNKRGVMHAHREARP